MPLSLQASLCNLQRGLRSCSCTEHSSCQPGFWVVSQNNSAHTKFTGLVSYSGPESICKISVVCAPSSKPYQWVIIQLQEEVIWG